MGHVGDTAFFCTGKKPILPGHVGGTTFLLVQKTHTTFRKLGGFAFDSAYDIK